MAKSNEPRWGNTTIPERYRQSCLVELGDLNIRNSGSAVRERRETRRRDDGLQQQRRTHD